MRHRVQYSDDRYRRRGREARSVDRCGCICRLLSQAENFGFSVFEAMASRVPVVVSDTLNYAEEIARSGAGLSVQRDVEQFADAILRLLADPSLRLETGPMVSFLPKNIRGKRPGSGLIVRLPAFCKSVRYLRI